ncbi:restriction endonuclease [Edaphobacillus lindanitolerans]|uniref:Restriction endonuclease n=1 Tax=Edaphobacillus lindanitolerans TaxID=550447 RepID=A0A1U7PRW6_9BACI|nr:restriction endonuclease [Edaphobacillus lindanitolerans]SIT88062.1 Restriction endonuclease [Edaphobacillus lindanitolerans]
MDKNRNKREENYFVPKPLRKCLLILGLFFLGMEITSQILLQNDLPASLLFWVFLILISVMLFRLLGLNKSFRRTHRIQNWKPKQKLTLYLYIFLNVLLIASMLNFSYQMVVFFFLVLFLFRRSIGQRAKKFEMMFPSFLRNLRKKSFHVDFVSMEDIDNMSGTEFEKFLFKLFDGLGYYVELTPHTDYGVDLIIIKNKIKTGIQAKCYGEGRTVGVAAVNEVCGGGGHYKVQKKAVITNRYFSKKAKISARSNNVAMIDREGLQDLIRKYNNK